MADAGANLPSAIRPPDGGRWTFSSGEIPGTLASSATSFVVTGENGNFGSDTDPGPGIDTVGGGTLYLSRFDF